LCVVFQKSGPGGCGVSSKLLWSSLTKKKKRMKKLQRSLVWVVCFVVGTKTVWGPGALKGIKQPE